jgi:hypothetical protein
MHGVLDVAINLVAFGRTFGERVQESLSSAP